MSTTVVVMILLASTANVLAEEREMTDAENKAAALNAAAEAGNTAAMAKSQLEMAKKPAKDMAAANAAKKEAAAAAEL